MNALSVVVTDHDFEDISAERAVFAQENIDLEVTNCRTEAEVVAAAREADGLLIQAAPITNSVIAQLSRCKVIARYGVGVDTIDLDAATRHRIVVANVKDYCVQEVADHAITLLLALARRTVVMNEQVKTGIWDVYRDGLPIRRLEGQTVGIVGFGSIGRAVAARAQAFGLRVLVYDPWVKPEVITSLRAHPRELPQLLGEADFVSLHSPLMAQTQYLIDVPQLRLMRPTAFLINTSRGGLVREIALVEALRDGVIAGAALDVLEQEPPDPSNPLLGMGNVILTPHAAFYSQESGRAMHTKAAQAALAVLSGHIPHSVVNPQVLASLPELK